jgi:DNA ligase-1
MDYSKICEVYEALENTSRGLEKTKIIAAFLGSIKEKPDYVYLLQGRVFADYDRREFGVSEQIATRIISKACGVEDFEVIEEYKNLGELGKAVEKIFKEKKRQKSLFSTTLNADKIFTNLRKLPEMEGKGAVDQKINLVVELLHSSSPLEAKYIIRTVLGDLKIGVGNGILRDAIVEYCFKPKDIAEKKEFANKLQEAYDKVTDMSEVFEKAISGKLDSIKLIPGKPVKVMLFPKAHDIKGAFEIVGRPAAFEYKYDGFRVMINKEENGNIRIFTRRLEEVTNQFPEILEYVKRNVRAKSFIIDGEAVGYNFKTKKYTQFQSISQRIKRKYDIIEMAKNFPIELNLFDIIYYGGENLIEEEFLKRRKILEKIVKQEKYKIVLSKQLISSDEKEVEGFYARALEDGQEGLMGKGLTAPYKPGARVGYAVKIKPQDNEFDLVITGAEWGTGKRAGWLTSYDVSCNNDGELLEVGKVSTGLKELEEEGLSFKEMTEILRPLVINEEGRSVKVKPEVVVMVAYQNIQKSPTYTSGYALRFPRIKRLRPDRGVSDIANLNEITKEAK